ncbi:unnamed protein product, partial [Ectocarpus sp. 12 AP-2014]
HLRTENIEERCWCGAGVAGRLCDETAVFVFGQVGTRQRLSACSKTPWCQDEVLGARDRWWSGWGRGALKAGQGGCAEELLVGGDMDGESGVGGCSVGERLG